jgi:hypothetical protein
VKSLNVGIPCSSNFLQFELLNKAKARTSKNVQLKLQIDKESISKVKFKNQFREIFKNQVQIDRGFIVCNILNNPPICTWFLTFSVLKFRVCWTGFLQATQAVEIQFKLGKNPVHQTRNFILENVKNQVQIDRGNIHLPVHLTSISPVWGTNARFESKLELESNQKLLIVVSIRVRTEPALAT